MRPSEPKHILVADDDRASRWVVERMLVRGIPGVRVSGVDDGAQALEVLTREPVDLLITDLSMPVLDGFELLLEVSRRRLAVPLLAMTASASTVAESQALSSGAIEFFAKPIQPGPFLDRVRELLFGERHRARLDIVSLAGIVRMIGAEAKTCALRVTTRGAAGLLVFVDGALVDARQGSLTGLPAARTILAWDDPTVTLDYDTRPHARTIDGAAAEVRDQTVCRPTTRGAATRRERPPVAPAAAAVDLVERPPEYVHAVSPPALCIGLDPADPAPAPALTMPAPMPPPAAIREPRHIVPTPTDLPEIAAVRRAPPPPSLTARAIVRHAKPPPVPPPPVVAAPPRASVVPPRFTPSPVIRMNAADTSQPPANHAPAGHAAADAPAAVPVAAVPVAEDIATADISTADIVTADITTGVTAPADIATADIATGVTAPADIVSAVTVPVDTAPAPPVTAEAVTAATVPAAPDTADAAVHTAVEPVVDTVVVDAVAAAPATAGTAAMNTAAADELPVLDVFELLDRARDLLRAADLEAAERVLRRALVVRPEDRVVQQNLRALARRRGDPLMSKHV